MEKPSEDFQAVFYCSVFLKRVQNSVFKAG